MSQHAQHGQEDSRKALGQATAGLPEPMFIRSCVVGQARQSLLDRSTARQIYSSTDLLLDTSTNGLKQVYTTPKAIYSKIYFVENVHLIIIFNF
jgi:hypothetical protein